MFFLWNFLLLGTQGKTAPANAWVACHIPWELANPETATWMSVGASMTLCLRLSLASPVCSQCMSLWGFSLRCFLPFWVSVSTFMCDLCIHTLVSTSVLCL